MTLSDSDNAKAVALRAKKEKWLRLDVTLVSGDDEMSDVSLVHPKHKVLVKRYTGKKVDMTSTEYNEYIRDLVEVPDDEGLEIDLPAWETEAEEIELVCRPEDDPIFDGILPDKP